MPPKTAPAHGTNPSFGALYHSLIFARGHKPNPRQTAPSEIRGFIGFTRGTFPFIIWNSDSRKHILNKNQSSGPPPCDSSRSMQKP